MNTETTDSILVINTGSSSIKFQLFKLPYLHLLARGKIANLDNSSIFSVSEINSNLDEPHPSTEKKLPQEYTHQYALNYILNWIDTHKQNWQIQVAAHRVAHGGDYFNASKLVTPDVISKLKTLCPLAPLHQPHNLAAIEMLAELKPNITQVACFDTAFHSSHDRLFIEYALPQRIRNKGIHRYGFHGLSYEWIAQQLQQSQPSLAKGKIIAAHLGNGASLCAMENGVSVDTTMGLTALDGLPMGTRCGSLDPGIIIYLIRELGLSANDVESILYNESGLKGLSNWTNDVRLLQESNNPNAQFALDYFCLKTAQNISMMAVSLGGIDGIVFTGGIGENSEFVRQHILSYLQFLMPYEVHIIKANEEKVMARHALQILKEQIGR